MDENINKALEIIVSERIEAQIYNEDHTTYWALIIDNVFNTSINSFVDSLSNFKNAIVNSPKKKELNSYHIKFMMRCISSDYIMSSVNHVYENLKANLVDTNNNYDIIQNNQVINLCNIDKVLLFLYIYEDRISIAVSDYMSKITPKNNRKFRV